MRNRLLEVIQHRHFTDGHSYDRHAERAFRRFHEQVAADVVALAPPGACVLDAGCGTGLLATRIARLRPDLRVVGVDLEQGMVDVAITRADREGVAVEFLVADLAELSLPDDSVDVVVSTASAHHWADVDAVLARLDRTLRPGGTMWIYDMRWVPSARLRSAATSLGLRVERTTVRTGRLPIALFQRLAVNRV